MVVFTSLGAKDEGDLTLILSCSTPVVPLTEPPLVGRSEGRWSLRWVGSWERPRASRHCEGGSGCVEKVTLERRTCAMLMQGGQGRGWPGHVLGDVAQCSSLRDP